MEWCPVTKTCNFSENFWEGCSPALQPLWTNRSCFTGGWTECFVVLLLNRSIAAWHWRWNTVHDFGSPVPDCTRVRNDDKTRNQQKYKEKQNRLEKEEEWKE